MFVPVWRVWPADGDLGVADAVEVEPVHVVALDEVGEDVHGIGGRVRVPEVDPELGADARARNVTLGSVTSVRVSQLSAPGEQGGSVLRVLVEAVEVEGMVRPGRGGQDRGMAIPDRARDDERVDLDARRVRLRDQVGQGIETRGQAPYDLGRAFQRVQVPRVPAPPHLREDRVRARGPRVVHHRHHVPVVAEARVEGIDPEGAVLAAGRVGRFGRERGRQRGGEDDANHQASREGSAHGTPLDVRAEL